MKKQSSRKGQSALEFTILIGFSLLVMSAIIIVSQNNLAEQTTKKDRTQVEQIMNVVNGEIGFAISSYPYYERAFYIPTRINGLEYNITSRDGVEVIINYNNKEYVYFLNNLTLKNYEYLKTGDLLIYKNCNATECEIGLKHPYACSYVRPEGNYTIDGDAFYCSGDGHMWSPTIALGSTLRWKSPPPNNPVVDNCIGQGLAFEVCHYCDILVYANLSDWYLPTIQELKGFYDNLPCDGLSCGSSNSNMDWDADADTSEYWSSTNADNTNAYVIDMNTGNNATRNKAIPPPIDFRCVRNI